MRPARLAALALLSLVASPARGAPPPAVAEARTIVSLGPTAGAVRLEPALDTSVATWTTATPSGGGCQVALMALPVRATSLAWDGKPRELLHARSAGGCDHPPRAITRVLGSEVWGAIAGERGVELGGLDYDGEVLGDLPPPSRPRDAGPLDLFRIGDVVILQAGTRLVGWPRAPSPQPIDDVLDLRGGIAAALSTGWVLGRDGSLRRIADPTTRAPAPAASLPASPASDPAVLADAGGGLVVATCAGGQLGVWRLDDPRPRLRKVFTGKGLGCPRAARVTEDGRILVATETVGKGGRREAAQLTLIARNGKPLGQALRLELDPAPDRELGVAYAGGNGRLLWVVHEGDAAVIRAADFTVLPDKLVWSGDAG